MFGGEKKEGEKNAQKYHILIIIQWNQVFMFYSVEHYVNAMAYDSSKSIIYIEKQHLTAIWLHLISKIKRFFTIPNKNITHKLQTNA